MLYSITCMLSVLVATLSWLPSSEVQHLLSQSPSCGMVLPSCFSPSLTGFQTTRQTLKGVPPILDVPTTALVHSSHQHTVCDESFSSVVPVQAGSGGAQAVPSTSVLRNIPTALLIMDKQESL